MRQRVLLLMGAMTPLLAPSLLRTYLLMPFPGSQELDSIDVAYALRPWIWPSRLLGAPLVVWAAVAVWRASVSRKGRVALSLVVIISVGFLYLSHAMSAPAWFLQPESLRFARGATKEIPPEALVVGVALTGEAKAYPLDLIAYHHVLMDDLAGQPILPTY